MHQPPEHERIDKWLWAARFFKTRALAAENLDRGRIQVAGITAKPSREVKVGDEVRIRQGSQVRIVIVQRLSLQRGSPALAQTFYQETPDSIDQRLLFTQQLKFAPDPARSISHGRPTKRDRRILEKNSRGRVVQWDEGWSASLDE